MNTKKHTFFKASLSILTICICFICVTTSRAQTPQNTAGSASNPQGQAANQVPDDPQSVREGQSLFAQHCTVCHAVGKQVIGPALASVHNRRPIDWLVGFIQNSQHVIIDEEDEYAQYLYQQYEQQVMPNFEFLSRDEILSILSYIKVESSSTTAGVSSVSQTQADMAQDQPSDESVVNSSREEAGAAPGGVSVLTIALVGVILVLMVVVIVLAARNRTKTNA